MDYTINIRWTGNKGQGTSTYTGYERSHIISAEKKPNLPCSSDARFRGDPTKYTPEDLLVASISGCHMLWYLHLCADAGIVVTDYTDTAKGTLVITDNGGGYFTEVTLFPSVTVAEPWMEEQANELHKKANELCFIANSCKFPVHHKPTCTVIADV